MDDPVALRNKAGDSTRAPWPVPPERWKKPPAGRWDFLERQYWQQTCSPEAFAAYRKHAEHKNRMKWHETMRQLVLVAGLMAVAAVFAYLSKTMGFSGQVTTEITVGGLASTVGGAVLRTLVTSRSGPSRRRRDQAGHDHDGSSRFAPGESHTERP
jgi:hypothetical protein